MSTSTATAPPAPAAAPDVPRDAPAAAAAPVAHPTRPGETTRRLGPRPASTAPSEALAWASAIARAAGEPDSVTVTTATHDVHVNVAGAEVFRAWCEHLRLTPEQVRRLVRRDDSHLGELAEVTVRRAGWALHVRVFGAAAREVA